MCHAGAPIALPTTLLQRANRFKLQAVAKACSPAPIDDADDSHLSLGTIKLQAVAKVGAPAPADDADDAYTSADTINNITGLSNNVVPFPRSAITTKDPVRLRRTRELLKTQPAVYWQMVEDMLQDKVDRILAADRNLRAERCKPAHDGALHPKDDLTKVDQENGTTMVYLYHTDNDAVRWGQFKIGYTGRSWKVRGGEHRRTCDHQPQLLVAWKVSFVDTHGMESVRQRQAAGKTLEKRLLATLKPLQDRTPCASPQCDTRHLEWFIGWELATSASGSTSSGKREKWGYSNSGTSKVPQLIRGRHTLVVAIAVWQP
jgi:hypothetical protein